MKNFKLLGFIIRSVIMGMIAALFLFTFFPQLMSPVLDNNDISTEPAAVLSFAEAIKKVSPSIVNIRTYIPSKANATSLNLGTGSGVIISSQGYIVTNYHVIANAEQIMVELTDGRAVIATVIGFDEESDLAVLKIALDNIPALTMDANVQVQVGDIALVIGHPFGIGQSVTLGIVSATGRRHLGISEYENYIQTDAAVNQGNSGGALINSRGDLLGISSAFFTVGTKTGISFAIPVSQAMDIIEQLIFNGKVVRGWLGFNGNPLNRFGIEKYGEHAYFVQSVAVGGPAEQAGLKVKDVILSVNEKTMKSISELHILIAESTIGSEITIKVNRDNQILTLKAIIKERPKASELRINR